MPGPRTPPSLADFKSRMPVSRQGWTRLFDRLVQAGLVARPSGTAHIEWSPAARIFLKQFGRQVRTCRKLWEQKKPKNALEDEYSPLLWTADEKRDCGFHKAGRVQVEQRESGQTELFPTDLVEFANLFGDMLLEECVQLVRLRISNAVTSSIHDGAATVSTVVGALRKAHAVCGRELDFRSHASIGSRQPDDFSEQQLEDLLVKEISGHLRSLYGEQGFVGCVTDLQGNADMLSNAAANREGSIVLMVDALDGVRNLDRAPLFAITAAVLQCMGSEWQPMCAAVLWPPAQEIFVGLREGHAVLLDDQRGTARRLRSQYRAQTQQWTVAAHLSTSHVRLSERFIRTTLRHLPRTVDRVLMLGSGSLAMAFVADGRVDAYLCPHSDPWHVYPGKLLIDLACQGSSTLVTDFWNNPWSYRSKQVLACDCTDIQELLLPLTRGWQKDGPSD